jgi:hypothetical protein
MRALTDSIALVEHTTRRIRVSSIDGCGPGGGRVDQLRLVQKAPIACFVPFRNANPSRGRLRGRLAGDKLLPWQKNLRLQLNYG